MTRNPATLTRRQFLISTARIAGGMAISAIPLGAQAARMASKPWGSATDDGEEFSPWIAIQADDTVVVRVPTPEIGNGAITQVAMNVAEELECAWDKVRVEFAAYAREFREPGSYSVGLQPFFGGHGTDHDRMHHAMQLGASARERLKAAAAARWGVPADEIEARDSVLRHGKRTLAFGDVAEAAGAITLDFEPALKPQSEWRFLGKAAPPKLNLPQVVNGSAIFGIDVTLPNMVHAALRQAPVHGGRLKSHAPDAVKDMPGVRAVIVIDPRKTPGSPVKSEAEFGLEGSEVRSGVAVIADHYWQAKMALDALPVEWDDRLGAYWESDDKIEAKQIEILDRKAGRKVWEAGDVDSVEPAQTVEATYHTPFCEHATIEPLNGTALVTDDAAEVWHPCQDMKQAFWVAVDETGLAPEKVKLHQTFIGGGFGRRVMAGDLRTVVAVARQYPGVPVKVIWSREETTLQGQYRTLLATRYKAGLDAAGMPQAIEGEACFSGLELVFGYMDTPYVQSGDVPNVRLTKSELPLHIQTGPYRGPCYNSHAFMAETFVDECAVAAGVDPLEYRLKLLKNWEESWKQCLRLAAKHAGWDKPLPKGQGRGIAISNWPHAGEREAGSTICAVARVEVTPEGQLTVKQVDVTFDCGRVANRDAVAAQLEGGVIYGMNMSINEGLTVKNGAIVESNFDSYPMLKMTDMPPINIHFDALTGHDRFAMIGEAPVGPIGPAIGNAIYQATGKRLRRTPFRKQDMSWS